MFVSSVKSSDDFLINVTIDNFDLKQHQFLKHVSW